MAFGFLHSQYRQLIPEKREKNGCLAFSQACPTSCLFPGFSPGLLACWKVWLGLIAAAL
jgi:hypothetical protein